MCGAMIFVADYFLPTAAKNNLKKLPKPI